MKTARQTAFDGLLSVEKNKAYSNIALDSILGESGLSPQDKSFATALFYGVLERRITLLHIIAGYSQKPVSKLDLEISIVLQMGLYQLLYLSGVPDNAAVDEAVRLAAYARKASAKGFVNAVLRGFLRDKKQVKLPDLQKDPIGHYSIKLACPPWILQLWNEQYGLETALALAEAALSRPPLMVRVNTLKTTAEKLIGYLENRGVEATLHPILQDCLLLEKTGEIDRLPQFKQGLFHVQDAASQLCAIALSPKKGDVVLDICSAPGSKSFTIAQLMENDGEIYSFDLFPHKLELIAKGAKRLGISIIKPILQDGTVFNETIKQGDCVLCDVPCSGLGILRRKPEIKQKTKEQLAGLPAVQLSILKNAACYVKPGGRLVYSTCTLNYAENEGVISEFLLENNLFEPLQFESKMSKMKDNHFFTTTLMPHESGCDGFFFAIMQRRVD